MGELNTLVNKYINFDKLSLGFKCVGVIFDAACTDIKAGLTQEHVRLAGLEPNE